MVMNVRLKVQIPATYAISFKWTKNYEGLVCGQVVSVLAFYSDDLSSNPTEVYNSSVKLNLKRMKINKKRPGLAHFSKRTKKAMVWNLFTIIRETGVINLPSNRSPSIGLTTRLALWPRHFHISSNL